MPLSAYDLALIAANLGEPGQPQISGNYAVGATLMRNQGMVTTTTIAATGVMLWTLVNLPGDTTITNVSVIGGGTATGTGTASFFALYRVDGTLLGQTTNDTTAANITSGVLYTRAFTTAIRTPYSGSYYIAFSQTATTVPTLLGITQATSTALQALAPVLSATGGSALGGVAPAVLPAATNSVSIPYMILA